jgi:hypothetical protein
MELVTDIGARKVHYEKSEREVVEYENDRNVPILFICCVHYTT